MLILGGLAISSGVAAHTLKETNARVILRDGQIEVRIITDMADWQKLLQDKKAWLMGDTEQVMPAGVTAEQQKQILTNVLENNTRITINRQPVSLKVASSFELIGGHGAEILLQGKHQITKVSMVSITFPKSLGAVYVSFVKPQYKMLTAGSSAVAQF
jgi:hypothetical protein